MYYAYRLYGFSLGLNSILDLSNQNVGDSSCQRHLFSQATWDRLVKKYKPKDTDWYTLPKKLVAQLQEIEKVNYANDDTFG